MSENQWSLSSMSAKIFASVMTTLIGGGLLAYFQGCFKESPSPSSNVENKIIEALAVYSKDINENTFDAYRYFAPQVERFFQMQTTTPKEINKYINGLYQKQYKNMNVSFDEATLAVLNTNEDYYEVQVIMRTSYYFVTGKKQVKDQRTKTVIKFNKSYKMLSLRHFND